MSGSSTASVGGAGPSKIWCTLASAWALIRDSERSIGEGAGGGRSCRIGSVLGGGRGESQHSTGASPEMSIARWKKEGGRGTREVPMTESSMEVQEKPASKVAGIWTKRHIGWLLRLRRDLSTPSDISPELVAWSLRAMPSRGGLAVR